MARPSEPWAINAILSSVRRLTNTTVRGVRYRWYATDTGVGIVGRAVAMVGSVPFVRTIINIYVEI
jgi:hypothetical protein